MSFSGFLIAIEGSDRIGKSTLCRHLTEELKAVKLSFPDRSGPIGELINEHLQKKNKQNPKTLHYLFTANRAEKEDLILSHLKKGEIVVCDRYYLSGQIYTKNKDYKDFHFKDQEQLNHFSQFEENFLLLPDLTIIVHEKNIENIETRKDFGKECFETLEFQKNINAEFEIYAKKNPHTTLLIQSTSDWTSVKQQIVKEIDARRKEKAMQKGKCDFFLTLYLSLFLSLSLSLFLSLSLSLSFSLPLFLSLSLSLSISISLSLCPSR